MMATHHPAARHSCALGIAGLLSLATTSVFASGFALIEQSVSSMGTAYAGAASNGQDASTIFFNPALMSRLEGEQMSAGVHAVLPKTEFTGMGTFNSTNPLVAQVPNLGGSTVPVSSGTGDGGNAGENGYLPHLAYVRDIDDRWKFGLTVNVPFGLSTKYDEGWVGRYSSLQAEIKAINLNPNFSFQVDDHTTLGFGISAMYTSLKYRNNIDYALLDMFGLLDPTGNGNSILPGAPAPGTSDATSQVDVDDWGFGFNAGILLEPSEHTRFGLAYRSKVNLEMGGDLQIAHSILPAVSDGATVNASLPETLMLSGYHEFDQSWAVMADLIWTKWSSINELRIKPDTRSPSIIPLQWEDTTRVAIGVTYRHSASLTLRTGIALDETPVPDASVRPTALPDEDRLWLALGAGYRLTRQLSFDVGYAHLFIDDTDINSTDAYTPPLATGFHRVTGKYDASVDIISAQANWKF